ncbi:MAG: CHAT domain-containing protein, partial [Thainema sp.]
EALLIAQEIGDRHGEGVTLSNIGLIYRKLEQYEQALNTYQDALLIAQEISDRRGEGVTLNNIGAVYKNLGQYEQALNTYQEALLIAQEIGDRHGEGVTLNNIGYLLEATEEPELAIVFLKQSVNQYEEIRGDIQGLSAEDQQTFTDSISSTYRKLADLLLQQNRIIEAQRVLDLLKVQELDEYLDDVQRNAQTETGVEFWQPEEDVLALYDDVLLAGTELARLQERDRNSLTPDEQARLAELTAQQDRVYTSFIDWLDHPDIITAIDQLREATRSRTVDIENFTDLQAQLAQLPQRSVILYPLVLENRLELVLVSADAPPVRYPVDVDAVELNRTVVTFGQALKDRNIDPRPLAKQIYDWTIANLETDLAAVGAENIIFAPDGVLRYVPLAALYDGEQWLAERFSFSQITAASETDFAARPRDRRTLLAAACADCAFTVNIGDDAFSFGNLPATLQEVELLASQIPGAELLINGEFTPARFKDLLGSANLIHLATHGKFVSGNPDESFILFGDEQSVNLREMRREWSQLDADLVVLSACETALGSPELGNGIEVLGLGFQLQRVGAKAVMASLWQVSDNGTQALMAEFYDGLNQGMTKAEALQAAQMAMITNQPSENAGQADLSAIADTGSEADGTVRAVSLAAQEMPGYSHPYYWAPFILIGNGL